MYLIVIAWSYVVLMMSLAEAFSPQGTLLGALITLLLYGVLPLSIVMYILGTPARKRALARQDAATSADEQGSATQPDEGRHAPGGAQASGIATVREKD